MVFTGNKIPDGNSMLTFPENLKKSASETDYIRFEFYKTKGAFSGGSSDDFNSYSNSTTETKSNKYPTICLYMPEDLSTSFKSNWEGTAVDVFTESLLRTQSLSSFANEIAETITGKGWAEGIARQAARAIEKTGTKLSGDDIFALRSGVVTNPNVELLFKQQELRTFQLKFKFTPTNENETNQAFDIINTFRTASLPTFGGSLSGKDAKDIKDEQGENFVTVPTLCKVSFIHKGQKHRYLPSYNVCAITDVKINYTPDNKYSTFTDGAPIATELTLGFLETKLQFSQNIY